MTTEARRILIGRVVGAFGIRGELKLESWTEPRDALFRYQPWTLVHRGVERVVVGATGRDTGRNIVARIPGLDDREAAEALVGAEIHVPRSALPKPKPGEYYWVDLEGLAVINLEGVEFGTVSHLFATGANDVLVVRGERERMLPYIPQVVRAVDLEARRITVDWDADF